MLTQRLELPDSEYSELKGHVDIFEERIELNARILEDSQRVNETLSFLYDPEREDYGATDEFFEDFEEHIFQFLQEHFDELSAEKLEQVLGFTAWTSYVRDYMFNRWRHSGPEANNARTELITAKRQLANTKEKMEGMDPTPRIYDRDDIEVQFNRLPGYVPGSVAISYTQRDNQPNNIIQASLQFEIESGWSTVNNMNSDLMPWFHNLEEDEKLRVPYTASVVHVNLLTQTIMIRPANARDKLYYNWEGGLNVHPHILNSNSPCFGDFAGPITEALTDQHWETFLALINLFLQQIDANDSAGSHWGHYFMREFGDRQPTSRPTERQYNRMYKHYFWTGNGYDMKLSEHPQQFIPANPAEVSPTREAIQQIWNEEVADRFTAATRAYTTAVNWTTDTTT